ncbi:hotdog domain-containing protein [Lactiplantibacillus plantarum]|nr:hotdog domain-containing protein [Lactiplantibacillus plantarum]
MHNSFFQVETGDFFVEAGMLNHLGILHGGVLMKKCDSTIGMLANEYTHSRVLTVAIKEFNFTKPGHVGDHIWFRTTLLKTSHHTMTFFTEVIGTDLDGHTEKVGEGVLVFVAVNEDLKPISVTPYHITNSKQRASVNQLIAAKL